MTQFQVKSSRLDLTWSSSQGCQTWLENYKTITDLILTWPGSHWLDFIFLPYKLTQFQIYNEVLLKKKEKIPQIMKLINFSLSFGFRLDLTWSNILAFWLDLTWLDILFIIKRLDLTWTFLVWLWLDLTWLEFFWCGYDLTWLELKKPDLTTPRIGSCGRGSII